MNPDLCNEIHVSRAIDPAAIMAGNATKTSQIIDRAGYEATGFLIETGVLTDAVYTCDVYESNDSGMAGEVAAASGDLIGQTAAFVITGTAGADSSKTFKVFYKGHKEFIRLKIVQTGATTGGYINAVAIQGKARFLPTT